MSTISKSKVYQGPLQQCYGPDRVSKVFQLILLGFMALQWVGIQAADLRLTSRERSWLESQESIRLGPAPNFPPFESIDADGNYVGIMAGFLDLMEQRLGVEFELVIEPSWAEMVAATRRREIGFWMAAVATPAREEFLKFTKPYFLLPTLIYTRDQEQHGMTLDDFAGKRVVMVKGYSSTIYVAEKYPDLDLHQVPDLKQALQLVSSGKADAVVVLRHKKGSGCLASIILSEV